MIAAFACPMCGYPLGSGGNLVITFPCSAPFNSGRPSLSSIFSFGIKISGKFSLISISCSSNDN
jgi:hypothetical protein